MADRKMHVDELHTDVDLVRRLLAARPSLPGKGALQTATWCGPPIWVHGDLSPGNLLLQDGRLTAVIDCAGLGVGDPACDLIVGWNLLPADARSVFRARLEVDDATWARGRGWALSIALIQLPYYRDTNTALAANARHVIREVLAEGTR